MQQDKNSQALVIVESLDPAPELLAMLDRLPPREREGWLPRLQRATQVGDFMASSVELPHPGRNLSGAVRVMSSNRCACSAREMKTLRPLTR